MLFGVASSGKKKKISCKFKLKKKFKSQIALFLIFQALVHSVPYGNQNGGGGMLQSFTGGSNPLPQQGNSFGTSGLQNGFQNPLSSVQNGATNSIPNFAGNSNPLNPASALGGNANPLSNVGGNFNPLNQFSALGGNANPLNQLPNLGGGAAGFIPGMNNGNGNGLTGNLPFIGGGNALPFGLGSGLSGITNTIKSGVSRPGSRRGSTSSNTSRRNSNSNSNSLLAGATKIPAVVSGVTGNWVVLNGQVMGFMADQIQNAGRSMQSYGKTGYQTVH